MATKWLGIFCSLLRRSVVLALEFCFNFFFKPLLVIVKNSLNVYLILQVVNWHLAQVLFTSKIIWILLPLPWHEYVKIGKWFKEWWLLMTIHIIAEMLLAKILNCFQLFFVFIIFICYCNYFYIYTFSPSPCPNEDMFYTVA